MLSGMAITAADLTLEAFTHTRSQTAAPKETSHGASPSLDPQRGKGNKQARLPESFLLGEVVPTSSMVPPIMVRVPSAKIAQGSTESVEALDSFIILFVHVLTFKGLGGSPNFPNYQKVL
jgi:hypothetical protein